MDFKKIKLLNTPLVSNAFSKTNSRATNLVVILVVSN